VLALNNYFGVAKTMACWKKKQFYFSTALGTACGNSGPTKKPQRYPL
jgi:hypothetical protein